MRIISNLPDIEALYECDHSHFKPFAAIIRRLLLERPEITKVGESSHLMIADDNIAIGIPFIPDVTDLVQMVPLQIDVLVADVEPSERKILRSLQRQRPQLLPPVDGILESWSFGDKLVDTHANLEKFIMGPMGDYCEQFASIMEETIYITVPDVQKFYKETVFAYPFMCLIDIEQMRATFGHVSPV
jgi:hypothetical protein